LTVRYSCEFEHQNTGECKTIVASLSLAECQSIESLRRHKGNETADVTAEAYALRKAYSEVPDGFRHSEPPKQILLS
jgi:hypothetical protein